MNEKFHEMLSFILEFDAGLTKGKARTLASFFGNLRDFIDVNEEDLKNVKGIKGKRPLILNNNEVENILSINKKGLINGSEDINNNYICAISRAFTKRQVDMIRSLTLDNLNPNPFLIKTLNLKSVEEVIKINIYMATTRSIVTSMGFFIENLLLGSSDSVTKGPRGEGWDLLKIDNKSKKHWVQIKSGPNDMDKDQIVYWAEKIEQKILEGDKAYIGITYGKRSNNTVTFGIMRQLLPDWEMKTLIGRELWDFISDDPHYHQKLFQILQNSSEQILQMNSIYNEIECCIERIINEFTSIYGNGSEGISKYIENIF